MRRGLNVMELISQAPWREAVTFSETPKLLLSLCYAAAERVGQQMAELMDL